MNDPRTPRPDLGSAPDAQAIDRLFDELDELRTHLAEEVRTRAVVIVDPDGTERARLTADGLTAGTIAVTDADGVERIRLTAADGDGRMAVADPDGTERITLGTQDGSATIAVRARPTTSHPTAVELFALDPAPDDPTDHPYAGIELIDHGNSTASFTVNETRPPQLRIDPPW